MGGEEASSIVRTWGEPVTPHEEPQTSEQEAWVRKPHWEVAERLGMIDLPAGAKITGSGWPLYKGAGSRLQRALINFFLDVHTTENGMTEVWPPVVVNEDSARGTGQIPDKEDQMYVATRDDLYLIPTAEVPVTNMHRDEIIEAEDLPIRYAAYSPCFRREAGAAGAKTRGILRVHQFDKVEMVAFCRPEESNDALEWMTSRAEDLLQRLGLPYRVKFMATGDMGFTQAKKYDLEVWAPGVEDWLEVSSVSNFRDYQARRMQIRYRPEKGAKPEILHTLNGSGLALARVVAAILEVYQQPDGSVVVPEALRDRMGEIDHPVATRGVPRAAGTRSPRPNVLARGALRALRLDRTPLVAAALPATRVTGRSSRVLARFRRRFTPVAGGTTEEPPFHPSDGSIDGRLRPVTLPTGQSAQCPPCRPLTDVRSPPWIREVVSNVEHNGT